MELNTPVDTHVYFESSDELVNSYTLNDYIEFMYSETKDLDIWFDGFEDSVCQYNETEMWLFDAKSVNYERVRKYILNRAPHSHRWEQSNFDIESHFNDYLYDSESGLIIKNRLKKELDKGKKIKDSVLYEWFLQFCIRQKFKSAQDCQNRALGAKTQAESDKIKAYQDGLVETKHQHEHDLEKMENNGYRIANLVTKKDKDTGDMIGEPEIVLNDLGNVEDEVELRSAHEHMKRLCYRRWLPEKGERMYQLYWELFTEKYTNKKVWAKARNVSYKKLVFEIEQVRDLMRANLSDFGYSDFGH